MVRKKNENFKYIMDRGPPDRRGRYIAVSAEHLPRVGDRILLTSYASNKDQRHRAYEVKAVTHTLGYFETEHGYYRGRSTPQKPMVEVHEVEMDIHHPARALA